MDLDAAGRPASVAGGTEAPHASTREELCASLVPTSSCLDHGVVHGSGSPAENRALSPGWRARVTRPSCS